MTRNRGAAPRGRHSGFSLVQIITVVSIIGILGSIAMPNFREYIERARVAEAIGDLGEIELAIRAFRIENNGGLPATLAEVGYAATPDPWGNDYRFVNLTGGGAARTDHAGDPVNTDYDLYSSGRDGASPGSLTSEQSRDDIIRGTNGAYVGLVEHYPRLP